MSCWVFQWMVHGAIRHSFVIGSRIFPCSRF